MKKRTKRPHIKAAARDANVVSTVRGRRRFVTSSGVNSWPTGAREPRAVMCLGISVHQRNGDRKA